MSSIYPREILELSLAERITLIEEIWDSIADSPEDLPVTAAQKAELDPRLAEHRADPTAGRSWEEVRSSLDTKILKVRFKPTAEADVREVSNWYRKKGPDLVPIIRRFRKG